jgi:hypothetical protein
MLGPAIGLFAAPWIGNGRHRAAVLFLSLLLFLLAAGDELVRVVAPPGEHIWLKPSQGILFLLYLVRHLFFPDGDPRQRSRFDSEPASEVAGRPVLAGAGTTERRGPFFS